MARDYWSCRRCGHPAESVDHRLPRSRGGDDSLFNLQALCGSGTTGCHGWKEHNPRDAIAAGFGVAGSIVRGVYTGPDALYQQHYNGEADAA